MAYERVSQKCYPLRGTAEAIRYLVEEHAQGKGVIIKFQSPESGQGGSEWS